MSMQLFSFGHPCEHQLRRTCIGGTSCPLNGYPDTWCCSYIKGKINFKRDKPCEGPRCRWGFSHPTQAQFDAVAQVLNESRPIAAKIDEAEDTDLLSFHIDNAHVVDTVQCALHMMRHPPSACAQRVGQLLAYAAVKTGETKVFMQLLKTMKKPVDGYILGAYAYLTQSSNPATAAAAAAATGNNNSGNANATGTTKSSKKNKNNNNNSSSDGKQHGQGNDVVEDLKNDMVDLMNAALSQGGHLVNREDQHLLQAVFIQALKNYHKNNKKRMEMLEAANQKFGDRLNAKDTTKEKEKDNGKTANTAAAAAQATPVKTAAQVVSQGSNTTTKETPAAVTPAAEATPPVAVAETTTTTTNNTTPAGTHRRTSNAKHNNAATAPNAHPSTTPSTTPSTVAAESARPASAEVTTTVTNASLEKRSETNTVNSNHTVASSAGNGHHSKTSSGPVTVSPGLSSHNAHNGTAQGKRTTLTSPPAAVATNGREGSVSPQSSLPREASSTTTTPVLTAAASRSSYPNSNTAAAPVGKTSESNRKSETTTTNNNNLHTNGNLKDNTNSPAPRLTTTTTTPPVSPAPPTQSTNTSITGHQASQTPVRTSNGSHAKTSGSTSSVSHTAGRPASATVVHVASSVSSSPAPPLVSGATASLGKVSPAATLSTEMKNNDTTLTSVNLQATTPLPPPQPSSGTMSYTKSSIAVPTTTTTNTVSPPRSAPPLPNRPVVFGISRLLELDHGAGLQAYYEPMDWAAPVPDVLLFGGQFSLRPTPAQGHATLGPAEKLRRSLHASPLPSPAAMPYNYIAAGSSSNNNSGNRNNNRSSSVSESNGNSPGATAAAASLQPVVSAAVAAAAAQPGAMFVDNVFGTAAAEPEFDNLDPAQLFKDITESWYN